MSGKNQAVEKIVVSLISSRCELTVEEIAKHLSIPTSTVSGILNRLVKKGVVVRKEKCKKGRGRPSFVYQIKLLGKVGVCRFDGSEVAGAIVGEELNIISMEKLLVGKIEGVDKARKIIISLLSKVLKSSGIRREELVGVGISINAVQMGDRMLMSSVLPWADKIIEDEFTQNLGLPVKFVRSSLVLAEYQKTESPIPNTLVRFIVGDGVSGHSVVNGKVLEGSSKLGGELGHIIIEPEGKLCGCGRRGCLEAYCSGSAIVEGMVEDLRKGIGSMVREKEIAECSPREAIEKIYRFWKDGDTFVRSYMDRVFSKLGWGLGLIVNILDPDVVRFGGYVLKDRWEWAEQIINRSSRWILHSASRNVKYEFSKVGLEDELQTIAIGFFYGSDGSA